MHIQKIISKATLLLLIVISFQVAIGDGFEDFKMRKENFLCKATKKIKIASKPITYDPAYTDNDTTKNSGEFDNKYLKKIFIRGIIKDKNCIPVPNASIEIWQNDEYGKKRYNQFSYSFSDRYRLNREQYSDFLGIATTTSDNNGFFSFVSVVPNSKLKRLKYNAPINISVSHEKFSQLESQIILNPKFPIKRSNKKIIALKSIKKKQVNDLPTYNFEIILDGTNLYKTY